MGAEPGKVGPPPLRPIPQATKIEPDPELQALLAAMAKTGRADDLLRGVADILKFVEGGRSDLEDLEFARQVLYFAAYGPPLEHRLAAVSELVQIELLRVISVNHDEFFDAAVPYVEAEDQRVRAAARLIIVFAGAYDVHYNWKDEPSFEHVGSYYGKYLVSRDGIPREDVPVHILRGIYEKHAGAALNTMHSVHQNELGVEESESILRHRRALADYAFWASRGLTPAPHLREDAMPRIRELAAHKQWWVRAFAAHTMNKRSELRDPKLIESMANDPSAVVRYAVEEILKDEAAKSRATTRSSVGSK